MTRTHYLIKITVPTDNSEELWESVLDICEENRADPTPMIIDGNPYYEGGEALKRDSRSREAAEYVNAKRLADELRHAYDTLHRLTPDSQDVGRIAELLRRVGRL